MWMTQALTKMHLYKTSYSKYGTAYIKNDAVRHKSF